MPQELHDHFFRRAKSEGYLSRAAYKLIEIDDRKRIVRPGHWVLDAGCAPGSWLQVLSQRVGSKGRVVGIDLKEVDGRLFGPTVRTVQGDLSTVLLEDLLGPWRGERARPGPPFDAVVSDMGPDTTGDPPGDSARSVRLCHDLLDRCTEFLRRGGHLVMKVYEGGDYPDLLRRAASAFEQAKGYKPDASRGESVEMYIVCRGWRPASTRTPPAQEDVSELPRRRPSSGWTR